MRRVRRREADRMLRMENMVEVVPLTQLSRSICRNKCVMNESNLTSTACQLIEAKVRQISQTAEVIPNSFARPKVVQC